MSRAKRKRKRARASSPSDVSTPPAAREDPIGEYRRRRDPERTPEPFSGRPSPDGAQRFVVQQHAARRMHWDVRLEMNGALASWAVPRGPSLDPAERRLAVRTEDHPLDYAGFEGRIPPGNYGAGAVIVWDRGSYRLLGDVGARSALESGKIDFELYGHKLCGRWALVRTKGDPRQWLLLKKRDPYARPGNTASEQPASILSGLTVEELAEEATREEHLADEADRLGATRRRLPRSALSPMLATAHEEPFSDARWIFELKYDGIRALALRDGDAVSLLSRRGREVANLFPEVVEALARLPCESFVVDGELVVPGPCGAGSFPLMQQRLGRQRAEDVERGRIEQPVVFHGFDLLAVAGRDLRRLPLEERKRLLRILSPTLGPVRYADHVERDGEAFYAAAVEHNVEGVMAKRRLSLYRSGKRSDDWRKIKRARTADLVVVGTVPGRTGRREIGSLAVAWRDGTSLRYAGNVGSGLGPSTIQSIRDRLVRRTSPPPALRGLPAAACREIDFAEPDTVVEARYLEITDGGRLRHPVFVALREDRDPRTADTVPRSHDVERIAPARSRRLPEDGTAGGTNRTRPPIEVPLRNLDKVFWPEAGITKGDLIDYYRRVWPWLAPYLRDRPVVLTRYPDGIHGKSFFQRNAPGFVPESIRTERIDDTDFFVCDELSSLLYVINLGCIPLHIWSSRCAHPQNPDWSILDLDPKGAPFADVVRIARYIHRLLGELALPGFIKTSGQEGVHILIPLARRLTHEQSRMFAELLARVVASELPEIATVARLPAQRGGKVYVDFLQNGLGRTIVAPFSVRPRPGAPVSMPISWRQVTRRLDPSRFDIARVPARLRRHGDPMRAVLESTADVDRALVELSERLSRA